MMLSTKGRYAVMAMVELARDESAAPVTLSVIAERQQIPLAYLEQIFARLKRAEVVDSVRGPGGGYRIAGNPEDISIAAIVLAAEEHITMTRCGGEEKRGCMTPKTRCLTHDLWDGLGQHIHAYLNSITLADVCESRIHVGHGDTSHFSVHAG
jgi:Rrf2 family transcriptional regulator, iron-sulfur cluster assembly transcription factor